MIDSTGMPRLVGLLGYPLEHSLSPMIHNLAFRQLGLNYLYVPFPVPPWHLKDAVRGLPALGLLGANVTIPHKEAVLPLVDSLSRVATRLGAVNTLIFQTGRIVGDNTDVEGFKQAWQRALPPGAQAGKVVLFGAGGAARAVFYALGEMGCREIVIFNRTRSRAERLIDDLGRYFPKLRVRFYLLRDHVALDEEIKGAAGLVNASAVGMNREAPESAEKLYLPRSLGNDFLVFDCVYNPLWTGLLKEARAAGAVVGDGLGMLVAQGAASLRLWTGREAPEELMYQEARRFLEEAESKKGADQ